MAALIAGGLISSISAMTWAGPRVAQAVGQDFLPCGSSLGPHWAASRGWLSGFKPCSFCSC